MDMGVRLAQCSHTLPYDRPSKPTPLVLATGWLLKKQARRRFQEKRPFAALYVRRAGAVPEPASRLLRTLAKETSINTSAGAAHIDARRADHFFFFGESTMIIWRPSIFGICST
jgi:hypothetical protein